MKKYLVGFCLLLQCSLFSQTKETYQVGLLLDFRTAELEPLIQILQDQIIAVVGEDANIIFSEKNILVNNYDTNLAKAHYDQMIEGDADIIIAFGAVNNEVFSNIKSFEKPSILFGSVTSEFYNLDYDKKTSGRENFTYLLAPLTYEDDLRVLKELTGFTKVGIAVEEGLMDILSFDQVFSKIAKDLGIEYKLIPYTTADEILNGIDSEIDAYYQATGIALSNAEIKLVASKLLEEKIPSFTTTSIGDVELGFMATNRSLENTNIFFRRIALNIEAYVNGVKLSEMPLFLEFNDKITLNINTTQVVGIPIKYSMIGDANIIGDLKNSVSEKRYNLLDVMEAVLGGNLLLKSSRKDVELSEQNVRTAWSNYFPSVNGSASFVYVNPETAERSFGNNPEYSTSGAVTLDQVVYSPDANANISIQKYILSAQREILTANELDAVYNASLAYFNALIAKANLSIQNENLNLTKTNLEIASQNYEAGQSGKSDVLRFTSEKAQNKQGLVEAVNALNQAFYNLNQLLNNPIEMEIDVVDAELGKGVLANYNYQELKVLIDDPSMRESFVEYLTEVAIQNSPDIKSLDYNLSATERSLQLNGAGRFIPTASLQGQYNYIFNRWGAGSTANEFIGLDLIDERYNIGVGISIPIVDRNLSNINRQIGQIQQDQLMINRENIELNIKANINAAILDLYNQIANIEISKISEEAAEESLELVQESYSNGAVNIVQLLDAQNNFLLAQQARVTAVYSFLASSIELERYLSYFFLLHTPEENQSFIQGFYEYVQSK
ncbi:MAG: TolC family protein [Flavobacteriales bacterium]|nr:TolC family protein [Flavobacteriales bacterium]